jgi:hypothetical protein
LRGSLERGVESRDDEGLVRPYPAEGGLEQGAVAAMRGVEAPAEEEDLQPTSPPSRPPRARSAGVWRSASSGTCFP